MDFWNNVLGFLKAGVGSRRVRIEEGDSLWTISEKYNVCTEELQAVNGLKSDLIFAGEFLLLPPPKKPHSNSLPASYSLFSRTPDSTPLPSPVAPPTHSPSSVSLYSSKPFGPLVANEKTRPIVVQPGDTAWDISMRFGITLEELSQYNGFVSDMIYPGDVLHLPEHVFLPKKKCLQFDRVVTSLKMGSPNFDFFDVFPRQRATDDYRQRLRGLLDGMRQVETSFIMPAPKGDDGLSIGPLQISEDYHSDAWWLAPRPSPYHRCEDVEYSERTVINYWLRYCPWAIEFGDFATLAKIHNGGPRFWRHVKTAIYWRKVKSAMRKFGYYKGIPELDPLLSNQTLCNNGKTLLFQHHLPPGFPFSRDRDRTETNAALSMSNVETILQLQSGNGIQDKK